MRSRSQNVLGASPSVSTGTSSPASLGIARARRAEVVPGAARPAASHHEQRSLSNLATKHAPDGLSRSRRRGTLPPDPSHPAHAADGLGTRRPGPDEDEASVPPAQEADGRFSFRLPATVGTSWSVSSREERRPDTPCSRNHSGSASGSRRRGPASSGRIRRHRPHGRWHQGGREPRVRRPPRRRPAPRWRERSRRPAREGVVLHFRGVRQPCSQGPRGPARGRARRGWHRGGLVAARRRPSGDPAQRGDEHSGEFLGACGIRAVDRRGPSRSRRSLPGQRATRAPARPPSGRATAGEGGLALPRRGRVREVLRVRGKGCRYAGRSGPLTSRSPASPSEARGPSRRRRCHAWLS